jgi:hypothetical protein
MLSKCANPSCTAAFLYLHEGKLFRMEVVQPSDGAQEDFKSDGNGRTTQRLEYFWLCDACAAQMTIVRTATGRVKTAPLMAFRAAS